MYLTPRLADLTPMDFYMLGFVQDSVKVSLLPTTLQQFQKRIRGACERLIKEFSVTCGRMLKIGLLYFEPMEAPTLNFIKRNNC